MGLSMASYNTDNLIAPTTDWTKHRAKDKKYHTIT